MRLIDADAFDERVRAAVGMSEEELSEDFKDGVQAVLYMMSKQPTITAQPERKKGQWIKTDELYETDEYRCSLCGQVLTTYRGKRMNYCPNCGADMRGERDEQAD